MYQFVRHIIDSIFPPRKEAVIVECLDDTDLQELYRPKRIGDMSALTSFTDVRMKALIHEAKFHHNTRAYLQLGRILRKHLETELLTDHTPYLCIPLPLSRERERTRGYNQVAEVLRAGVTSLPHVRIATNILTRVRDTVPQTLLNREKRLTNMRGAFSVIDSQTILDQDVILIDDVLTTGATLEAARDAVHKARPRSLTCIALAH